MDFIDQDQIKMSESERRKISSFIEERFGIKMPPSKATLLISRLSKRLITLGLKTFGDYFKYINSQEGMANEIYIFIDLISTHETSFFREAKHYDILLSKVLPKIVTECGAGLKHPLRILSAACSTGEEPYTIAVVVSEFIASNNYVNFKYHITGTDISLKVLETARHGVYDAHKIDNVPKKYKTKYFMVNKNKGSNLVRIVPELRADIDFFPINLMNESYPFEYEYDVIFLKNVLIYFGREDQEKIILRLLKYLAPGGFFFVGLSESMAGLGLPIKSVMPSIFRKH
ncbi:MAG: CheR family methyltransferase [Spirochaetota bacterium]